MQNVSQYLTLSKALIDIPNLAERLEKPVTYRNRHLASLLPADNDCQAVLAWGKKPSAVAAERYASRHNLPLLRLEDAFLRSVELGAHTPPLGIILDEQGIYYDANHASQLEELIKESLTDKQRTRCRQLIELWRNSRVSKYNHCRGQAIDYKRPYVLLVDQTFGDASIRYGQASGDSFKQMLNDAKQRFPDHLVVIKTHPDVVAGIKQGHFSASEIESQNGVVLEGRELHPADLIEPADAVFCVTSQMGFEALLWGKAVYTFGMPFYAGWGLTTDALGAPQRRQSVNLEQLVYAALIKYARYWHPEKQHACTIETLIEWLGQQRKWRSELPSKLFAERFPRWKRQFLESFLAGSQLHYLPRNAELPADSPCVVWGRTEAANRISVEDGFIRSVGLGADLIAPKSWVVDDMGMYYDATRPSKLEYLLNNETFTDSQKARASAIIERLVTEQVSKYNIGTESWQRPVGREKVILVPGQVESDASVAYGSPNIKANVELLREVSARNPDAYVVYKPHPDVVAGLRKRDSAANQMTKFCQEIVINDNMASLLDKVDEVHTMTSLTGFEALLRGLPVTCYGQPFYSGWGLTTDIWPNKRRSRQRSMEELVAAALIVYPRYLSANSGKLTSIEQALDEIAAERRSPRIGRRHHWKQSCKRLILRINRF